jgi:hypothetical protein
MPVSTPLSRRHIAEAAGSKCHISQAYIEISMLIGIHCWI